MATLFCYRQKRRIDDKEERVERLILLSTSG